MFAFCRAGDRFSDPTDDACTNPDTCDDSGACQDNHEPATTVCRDDTGECDVAELCDGAGSCPADGYEPAGTSCGDPRDEACTNPDTCDGSGSCQDNHEPDTTPCEDEFYCTDGDTCQSGACVGGLARGCSDQNPCTYDSCNEEEDKCDHDLFGENGDLNEGLVAYYPFNGNANDESENGNDGTVNGATLTTDRFGNENSAYNFDGNDSIAIPDHSTLTLGLDQFTIASWVQFSNFGANGGYYLMGQSEGPGNTTKWIFWLDNNGISFIMTNPTGWIGIGTFEFEIGQWYQVAVQRNGNELTAFVNGSPIGSASVSITTPDPNASFQIGTAEGDRPNRLFRGVIDEVRVYNRALSESEIQELYNEGVCCSDTDCDDGDACNGVETCVEGVCVDGTPLDDGEICREAAGACDIAETCLSAECPPDGKSTAECHPSTGDCDVAEVCDGVNDDCPADGYELAGTSCGDPTDDACTNPDTCDVSGACQDNHKPATTVCRADAGECDVAELCDGVGSCPANGYESAGTACGDPADDACTNPDTCDGSGACQDNHEDDCIPLCSTATPSESEIWPVNHKMVDIEILNIQDQDGNPMSTVTITAITQDESVNGEGDGNTFPDADGVGTDTAHLRAERSGQGNSGRVYEISFTASDDQGEECVGSVQVCVPHDKDDDCVDDGQDYGSTAWYEFNVDINLDVEDDEPVEICFTPDRSLDKDPVVTVTLQAGEGTLGNGTETISQGSELTVTPVDDPCSDGPMYCLSYWPSQTDSEVKIWIQEDPNNTVIPGFVAFQAAYFDVKDENDTATSFCIFNVMGGDGILQTSGCETDNAHFEVNAGVLTGANDSDCIPLKIVNVEDPDIESKLPNKMVTKICDINLPQGVKIAGGETVLLTLSFELPTGWDPQEFEENLEIFYYNEKNKKWELVAETKNNGTASVKWDNAEKTAGTVAFPTDHLSKFSGSSKQNSSGDDDDNGDGTQATGGGGGGCSVTMADHNTDLVIVDSDNAT